MKKNTMLRAAALLSILILSAAMSSCSKIDSIKESVEASKNAGVSTEDGWTINDDGSFIYAVVVENTSDKILTKAVAHMDGLDEEGNVLNDKELDPGYFRFGPLFPGERSVLTMDSETLREDGSSLWPETPSSFSCSISEIVWGDTDVPQITVSDFEKQEGSYGNSYTLTLKNNGSEDFDWQKLIDEQNVSPVHMDVYEVVRDGDGKIIGGSWLYFSEFEEGTYPDIPAGGEVTAEAGGTFSLPEGSDSELYITRSR